MPSNADATAGERKFGALPYVVAGMSFIPLIGVLIGLVVIGWGLLTRRRGGKTLALIGTAGIGFTILIYGSLFYFGFVQRGGVYDDLRTKLAQANLNSLVKTIEFYKTTHGEYPESLEALKASVPKDSFEMLGFYDPRVSSGSKGGQYFYYRRADSLHYYLRGVAPDGKPFSPGALVPEMASAPHTGLLTAAPPAPPPDNP